MEPENKELRFEDLPKAMAEIIHRVREIRHMVEDLATQYDEKPRPPISTDVAASMLCKSKSTIYKLVAADEIPYHKQGNRLYFFEDELIEWITTHKSQAEKEAEYRAAQNAAYEYLEKRRNKPYLLKKADKEKN